MRRHSTRPAMSALVVLIALSAVASCTTPKAAPKVTIHGRVGSVDNFAAMFGHGCGDGPLDPADLADAWFVGATLTFRDGQGKVIGTATTSGDSVAVATVEGGCLQYATYSVTLPKTEFYQLTYDFGEFGSSDGSEAVSYGDLVKEGGQWEDIVYSL